MTSSVLHFVKLELLVIVVWVGISDSHLIALRERLDGLPPTIDRVAMDRSGGRVVEMEVEYLVAVASARLTRTQGIIPWERLQGFGTFVGSIASNVVLAGAKMSYNHLLIFLSCSGARSWTDPIFPWKTLHSSFSLRFCIANDMIDATRKGHRVLHWVNRKMGRRRRRWG